MCAAYETSVGSRFCVMRSSAINKGDLWLWHSCPSLHSLTISHPLNLGHPAFSSGPHFLRGETTVPRLTSIAIAIATARRIPDTTLVEEYEAA